MNNRNSNLAHKVKQRPSNAPQSLKKPKSNLRVVDKKKIEERILAHKMFNLRVFSYSMCAIIAFCAFSILYVNTNLAVLVKTESELKSTLNELRSEEIYTSAKIENLFNLGFVEEYAKDTLNMINFDNSQIEYVYIENDDKVLVGVQESIKTKIFNNIWNIFNK